MSTELYVGHALYWTTSHERIAAGRGWALVTAKGGDGPPVFSVRRYTEGLIHHFANDGFAQQEVKRLAGKEDCTALLALAIIRASQDSDSKGLCPGEFRP